jgi:hypothetical protein
MKQIDQIQLDTPFFLRNLLVYPLSGGNGGDFVTLDEGLGEGWAKIQDPGQVERAVLEYSGADPMFLLNGEEILGALQNRVMNTAVLVGENSIVELPVSCAEEGRWSGSEEFATGHSAAFPSLRAVLADSVTQSLSRGKGFTSDQKGIWDTIRDTLTHLNVQSQTQSMHDAYQTLQDEVKRYTEGMDFNGRYSGFIGAAGGRVLGMDYFGSRSLFGKLKEKLILSYGLEALRLTGEGQTAADDDLVEKFLEDVRNLKFEEYEAVDLGTELRATTEDYASAALVNDDGLVHLSAFAKPK